MPSNVRETASANVDGLIRALLWCYLMLLPFAHWLSPSGWLPLANVPLLGAATLLPFSNQGRIQFVWRDFLLLSLAVLGVVSTLANVDTLTGKSVNHMSALLFVTVLSYFVGGRVIFSYLRGVWHTPLLVGYLFSCSLCVFEYVLVNFVGIPLPGYRPSMGEYDSTFILGVRPRSTFSESGHFAFYLACVTPILVTAYSEQGRKTVVKVVLLAFLASATFLFSTTLFLLICVWVLMYAWIHRLHRRPWGFLVIVLIGSMILTFWPIFLELADTLVLHKFRTFSFDDRQEKFDAVMSRMMDSGPVSAVFGHGMGSFSGLGMEDSISSYANFARDTGLLGMAFFLLAILPLESCYRVVSRTWRLGFLFLGVGLVLFFTAVPNYYFPHLAFVLGLMSTLGSRVHSKLVVARMGGILKGASS